MRFRAWNVDDCLSASEGDLVKSTVRRLMKDVIPVLPCLIKQEVDDGAAS